MSRAQVLAAVKAGTMSIDEAEAVLAAEPSGRTTLAAAPDRAPSTRRKGPSVDDIVTLAAHGVDADYARALYAAGFEELTSNEIIAYWSVGLTVETLVELRNTGYGGRPLQDVVGMAMNGVDTAFLRELRDNNLLGLSTAELLGLKTSGVSPRALAHLRDGGLPRASVPELIGLALNGVDAEFLNELKADGLIDRPAGELIALAVERNRAKLAAARDGGAEA